MNQATTAELRERLSAALAGRLEVGQLLGTGGFAAVFRGRDPLLQRDVAIKVLAPSVALSPAATEELLREARLVAAIEHPHIVPLYEAGNADGLVYLVMRYVPDGSLTKRLTGPMPAAEVARIGTQVVDALAAAHQRGVAHLDIKPDNLLVDAAGNIAVADFGIAQLITSSKPRDLGSVSGSPWYMSPEQVAGDAVDGRADLYALGNVLYEAATGSRPVRGDSPQEIMANQVRQVPAPIGKLRPEFPAPLAGVIMRALAKDPAERWPGAAQMAEALRQAASSEKLVSPAEQRQRVRRRWYRGGAILAVGLVAGFGFLAWWVVKMVKLVISGHPPAIDATAPNIAPATLDSLGSRVLLEGDTVKYVYAPNGGTLSNALVVTQSALLTLHDWEARRYPLSEHPEVRVDLNDKGGAVMIRRQGDEAFDTVFTPVTGMEQQALMLGLKRVLPDRDTTPR